MTVDLNDHVVMVTGAARNIGKAIGDVLSENGAKVIYTDINFDAIDGSFDASPNHLKAILDVVDERQIEDVVNQIASEHGRLDIVVNNAAMVCMKHRVTIDEFPVNEWNKIVDVNLTGVYLVSRAASKVMIKQGFGRIINIASVAGLVPLRLQCAYDAAKAGVINLTKAMAIELGSRGILVNCIAPGSILTDATKALFYGEGEVLTEKAKRMLDHVPLGRPGTPKEVAQVALFLAAPESSYVTGHCLTVDGGWTTGYLRDF